MSWEEQKQWADRYLPAIKDIICAVAGEVIEISVSSIEVDQTQATDYIIEIARGDCACRIREEYYWHKHGDFTLRYWIANGRKTEEAKIREGKARWYLYAWTKRGSENELLSWIFVDLDRLRKSGLLESKRRIWYNPGRKTGFHAYTLLELQQNNCIVDMNAEARQRTEKQARWQT